ncbi:hypothetical protein O2K51_10355 [Apibacter raozihei]|uniref:hypothetical protein n=1 Tax=Apibacter raozihei TaxID=2500547 RepID=UPI000FE3A65A|nr:hypothetical protein [Apibacter raozihei]
MQSFFGNVNNYGRKSLNKIVSQGYIYIKNQEVSIKNKKEKKEYLMQLINPEFSSIIEVYGDPMAKETGGVSFGGGPTIGGGVTKSYYVKKGDKVYWLEKKDFNDYYNELFGDCKEFMNKYPLESADWRNLGYLILEYTKLASEEK